MSGVSAWIDARRPPVRATLLFAAAGLFYTLFWVTHARHGWHAYGDLWNSAGLALAVGHGHWASVYAPPSQLDAAPGFEFLLAPVMVAGHALGLGTTVAEGSGYKAFSFILTPVATIMAGSVLFALDAIARRWGYSETRRLALSFVAGLGVVSAAAFWGHPEDCIALACVLWAALAVDRDGAAGLKRAGWLLGVAVACQPLALLAVAPVVARFGWRGLRAVAWRLVLPSALVTLPELIASRARTLHAIVDQPYNPAGESRTPFGHFARALGHQMYSGGTLRLIATIAAVALGVFVCRRRHDLPTVLLVMAMAFTIRVVLETELLGFYLFPVAAICLLLTLRSRSWSLFGACGVASIVCLVLGNRRADDLVLWWPAIMATTIVMVGLAHAACRQSDTGGSRQPFTAHGLTAAVPAASSASRAASRQP
jgi:hypothetical protein